MVRLSSLFFFVSRRFRLRDEFLLLYGVTRYTNWSYSHEVTTFLTLDNVYILVCTDCLVFSDVYLSLVVGIGLFRPNKRQVTSGFAPYTKSVERNARDTKVTPRECLKALDGRGTFLFSGCRPRFSSRRLIVSSSTQIFTISSRCGPSLTTFLHLWEQTIPEKIVANNPAVKG